MLYILSIFTNSLRFLGTAIDLLIQERIYVSNEYPTFARTALVVCQKPRILRQIAWNERQILSVLMKNMQILRYNIKILKFSAPYCWGQKFNTLLVG